MARSPRRCTLMAKPSGPACNLACSYCFYLDKAALYPGRTRMDDATLEAFVRQTIAAQGGDEVHFAWQGGEPTLLGLGFYERAVALQRQYAGGRRITNALQTNGLLVDEAWAGFLAEHAFLVGLSLDGPRALHERHRGPSFDGAVAALGWLQRHGVAVNSLSTVHRDTEDHGAEVYGFLRDLGLTWMQFIPVVERDGAGGVTAWSVSAAGYGRYLMEVFDAWAREDVGRVAVRLFEELLVAWTGGSPSLCVHAEVCGSALVCEHTGDVYSCDHFVDPEHLLGSLRDHPLAELAYGPAQTAFGLAKRDGLSRTCRACRWRFTCHGGCPAHRLAQGEPSYLCPSYLALYRHVAPTMASLAGVGRNDPCPCGSGEKLKRCCGG